MHVPSANKPEQRARWRATLEAGRTGALSGASFTRCASFTSCALLASWLVAGTARAQDPQGAQASPAAVPLRATEPASPGGDPRVVELNEQGSALYAAGDYRRAVEMFLQAYAVDRDPNLLFNIAACYEGLGDAEAALEKYRAFLDAPDADPAGRPRAERAIERLGTAPPPPAPVPPANDPEPPPAPVPVRAAPPPADTPGLPSWAPWVGLGGGVALGAVGATFYLLGAADHAEVTDARGFDDSNAVVGMTRAEARDLVRSGDTKKRLGVGAAATGGALILGYVAWWLLAGDADTGSDTAGALNPRFDVAVGGSSASLLLSGQY